MGYLLINLKQKRHTLLLSLLFIILGFILSLYFEAVGLNEAFISPGIVVLTSGLFLLIFNLSNKLDSRMPNSVRTFITILSQAAFGVYFIHELVLRGYRNISDNFYLLNFSQPLDNYINAILLFLASFILIFILRQIPHLKKIIS